MPAAQASFAPSRIEQGECRERVGQRFVMGFHEVHTSIPEHLRETRRILAREWIHEEPRLIFYSDASPAR